LVDALRQAAGDSEKARLAHRMLSLIKIWPADYRTNNLMAENNAIGQGRLDPERSKNKSLRQQRDAGDHDLNLQRRETGQSSARSEQRLSLFPAHEEQPP